MEDLRSTLLGSKKWDLNHLKFIVNAANELDKNPQTSQAVWTWIDAFANAHASTPDPSLFSELATLANDPNAGGLSDRLRQKAIHLEFIDCKEITKKIGT